MKNRNLFVFFAIILLAAGNLKAQVLFWDANDITSGAGDTPVGTWGSDNFWSTDSTGSISAGAWVDGSTAVFSAGTDATNSFTITLTGTQTVSGLTFEEGNLAITGGNMTLIAPAIINVATNLNITNSSIIGGTAGLIKTNTGTIRLTANNTFTGPVVVGGGTLIIPGETSATAGAANPLGAAPSAATPGSIVLSNNAILRSTKSGVGSSFLIPNRGVTLGAGGGNFEITDTTAGNYLAYSGIIAGSGTFSKRGNGVYYPSGANTYTGNTTNRAGTIRIPNNTATIFGATSSTLVMAGGDFLYPFDTGNRTIGNKILMTANTTISGTPTNNFRAVSFTNNSVTTTGGTLTIRNVGGGTANFQVRFVGGGFTFSRPIVIGTNGESPAQLDFLNDIPAGGSIADQTFSGVISGPGSVRRTCAGDGTGGRTVLAGANTYAGGTFLNGGHLGAGSDSTNYPVTAGPFGVGTILVADDGNDGFFASLSAHSIGNDVSFNEPTATKFTISGSNALTFYGALNLGTAAKTLYVSNTALSTVSGVVSGSASGTAFTKAGPGTLALSGNNTYSGDTLISGGQLLVNSVTGSGTSSGSVTVNAGATLGGSGNIAGNVVVSGSVAPGANGIGKLTVQNGIDLSASSAMVWELGALKDNSNGSAGVDFDQLAVTGGNLALGGSSTLSITFATPALAPSSTNSFWLTNHTWTVVSVSGAGGNAGSSQFNSLQNATYPVGYFTNTVDGSGSQLLSFIPTYVAPPSPLITPGLTGAGTANVGLSWSSVNGAQYQVQYKNDLNATNWALLGSVTASGSTASFTDTTGPATNRFYRVVAP